VASKLASPHGVNSIEPNNPNKECPFLFRDFRRNPIRVHLLSDRRGRRIPATVEKTDKFGGVFRGPLRNQVTDPHEKGRIDQEQQSPFPTHRLLLSHRPGIHRRFIQPDETIPG